MLAIVRVPAGAARRGRARRRGAVGGRAGAGAAVAGQGGEQGVPAEAFVLQLQLEVLADLIRELLVLLVQGPFQLSLELRQEVVRGSVITTLQDVAAVLASPPWCCAHQRELLVYVLQHLPLPQDQLLLPPGLSLLQLRSKTEAAEIKDRRGDGVGVLGISTWRYDRTLRIKATES